MSFDFSNNNINQLKSQAAYKDGGGMGGGGMYMKNGKKKKEDSEKEIELFEPKEEQNKDEITFKTDISEKDIPQETLFNPFVNWFRQGC